VSVATLVLAPLVWMLHFVAVYVLVSLVCSSGAALAHLVPGGVALATAGALGYFAYAGLASYRARRLSAAGDGRFFIASTGLLLCGLSALGTLWVAFPAFVLPPCAS
jgi:hypothetical protein